MSEGGIPNEAQAPEKPNKKEGNSYYEIFWPLWSSTIWLTPLHMLDIRRRAYIQEGQKVLELASGYPLWKIYSGQVGKTGLFVALDCNEKISKRSRKITRLLNLGKENPSEQITTADAKNLPFLDESIDLVIINNLPNNLPRVENVYREALRVLKPKGRLISSSTSPLDLHMNLIKEAGFTNVQKRIGIPAGTIIIPNMFVIASKPSLKESS